MLEKDEILSCVKCQRLRDVTPFPAPYVKYTRNLKNIKLFIVGRNPGLEDNYTNITKENFMQVYHEKWWVCKIGVYLRWQFSDEIIQNNTFFTNICKCSSPENTKLQEIEIQNCQSYLLEQINLISPKIIITLGTEAFQSLTNRKLSINFGNAISYGETIQLYGLYHPSYFSYKNDKAVEEKQNKLILQIREELEEFL